MSNVSNNKRNSIEEKEVKRPRCKYCGNELVYIVKYCPRCGEELI